MPESYWSSDVLGRQRGTWPRTWQGSLPSSHRLFCSCIALSHFLCLFIVVRKKRIFSIFSLSSTSAKPSVYVPAHTHTRTKNISCQVKVFFAEAVAPNWVQSDWVSISGDDLFILMPGDCGMCMRVDWFGDFLAGLKFLTKFFLRLGIRG